MHRALTCAALALSATSFLPSTAAAARRDSRIPGRYIVVYDSSVSTTESSGATSARERRDGFRAALRYQRAVRGFAAHLTAGQVQRLQRDPDVASVTPDREVHATATPLAAGETVPTGVARMQAVAGGTARGASSVNVAVIDTGIDLTHPDLNATSGTNCVAPGTPANDDNGHGTHVAGTIGALNTGSGVVGLAPGTHLFAAKVLNAQGSGTESQVICGIDWATSTRTDSDPTNDITVANMSLGGVGPALKPCATETEPEHLAVCRAAAAGITMVVAAGNSGYDFDYAPGPDVPAAYPEALTVTAMSDSDGRSGASGPAPSCRTGERDDRYASFSNYAATAAGRAHTIAAPGVCIRSTWMGGGYNTISGTSMATPHMTGAVALCFGEGGAAGPCTGLTPAQVIAKMRADASAEPSAFGFTGDPLHPVTGRYYGPLAYAGADATPAPPPAAPVALAPGAVTISSGTLKSGTASSLANDDTSLLQVGATTAAPFISSWSGTFSAVPSALSALTVTYKGRASTKCTQTLDILRDDGAWVTLDSRVVGTTDVLIDGLTPPGALSDYVDAGGQVRVRATCSRPSSSFKHIANLLRLTYTRAS